VLDRPDHIAASPSDRCRLVLLDDHTLSNAEVALRARATRQLAASVRRRLISLGVLAPQRAAAPSRFPRYKALPRSPRQLTEGACVGHPSADAWTSADPGDRAFARNVCWFACHLTEQCFTWSLSLPADDLAIYGAGTAADRERARRQLAGKPVPLRSTTAGKNAARGRRRAAARSARQAEAS
jgi:hypothetical protein